MEEITILKVAVQDILETNAYFYIDNKTKRGFLIDPGAEADKLISIIKQNGWIIEKILLTHGHFDHIGAVNKLNKDLNVPYFIHKNGESFLKSTHYNLSQYCERNIVLINGNYFNDGDIISVSENPEIKLQIIHTPGHTPDSVIFYDKKHKIAFVGDTIFKMGVGNTGFPGGNHEQLSDSIMNKIFKLPDDTVLYPGHSDKTTIAAEKCQFF